MKLGIFVNTNRNLDAVRGITHAAMQKGHEVVLFVIDDGTRFLSIPAFTELAKIKGVQMAFCDHSALHLGTKPATVPEGIACGSQFDNAQMNHNADKVIVL